MTLSLEDVMWLVLNADELIILAEKYLGLHPDHFPPTEAERLSGLREKIVAFKGVLGLLGEVAEVAEELADDLEDLVPVEDEVVEEVSVQDEVVEKVEELVEEPVEKVLEEEPESEPEPVAEEPCCEEVPESPVEVVLPEESDEEPKEQSAVEALMAKMQAMAQELDALKAKGAESDE